MIRVSGVAADEHVWGRFEPLWQKALDKNQVPERLFSMSDLMSGRKNFKDGWDNLSRRYKLLKDLFNVLGGFRHLGLSAYSCTILFDAYEKAKTQIPHLRVPEEICVDYCVGSLQLTPDELTEPQELLLYFDRNEGFLRTIDRVWRKGRKQKIGWPMQVRNIFPVDSSYYPIQAADLLAWIANRVRRRAAEQGEPQPQPRLSFDRALDLYSALFFDSWMMISHHMMWYDDHLQIIKRYPNG
jgi:hypothetical protein